MSKKRKRVLLYKAWLYPWFVDFAKELNKYFEVTISTSSISGPYKEYGKSFGFTSANNIYLLPSTNLFHAFCINPLHYFRLFKQKYDYAIIVDSNLTTSQILFWICYFLHIKTYFINADTVYCFGKGPIKKILGQLKRKTERVALLLSGKLVTESNKAKTLFQTRYRLDPRRIKIIPHGTDLEYFHPQERDEKANRSFGFSYNKSDAVVLFTGGYFYHKGIEYLSESIRYPALRHIKFLIIDYGPEKEFREKLISLANVTLIPKVEFRDMPKLYQVADIFLMPSVAYESDAERSPNTLIEAMASGLACIATDCGGIRDYLGEGGILIPEKNTISIVDSILTVNENLPYYKTKSRKWAENNLDNKTYAKKVMGYLNIPME